MTLEIYTDAMNKGVIPPARALLSIKASESRNKTEIVCQKCDTVIFKKGVALPIPTTPEVFSFLIRKRMSVFQNTTFYF